MKRFFLLLLILLVAGAWLGQLMIQDPGYVLLSYRDTTIETSLWVLLLLAIVGFALLHWALNLLNRARMPAQRLRNWSGQRNQRIAQSRIQKGLLALSAGDWRKAQRTLTQAAERSEQPLISYLAAAQAAHEQGEAETADNLLQKAREAMPKAEVAIGIVQAQIQLARGESEAALRTLLALKQRAPKHSYVLRLLQQAYLNLQDWQGLQQLLPELRRQEVLPVEQIRALELESARHLLQLSLAQQPAEAERKTRLHALALTWQNLPPSCTHNAGLIAEYANLMSASGNPDEAEKLLRERIRQEWDESLVATYGRIASSDPHRQLEMAKGWSSKHENSAALELTLGRLSMLNQLWGSASKHLERSLSLQANPETYAELSRLLAGLGQQERAGKLSAYGFELSNGPLPALPLPDSQSSPAS